MCEEPKRPLGRFISRRDAHDLRGPAVVVDVLRAFTTAAYALARGAERIVLVGTVADAEALRRRLPGCLLMGEVGGVRVPGWELSNSPVELAAADVAGRTLVQRTSAGTQGVLAVPHATPVLCASLVCASATARALAEARADPTYVITGWGEDVAAETDGDEDLAAAELIEQLRHRPVDPAPYVDRVRQSLAARQLASNPNAGHPDDVAYALELDRFRFAMVATPGPNGVELRCLDPA